MEELHTLMIKKFPFGKAKWPSTHLSRCSKFNEMTPHDRMVLLESIGGCLMCVSWEHSADICKVRSKSKCPIVSSGSVCGLNHHQLLHGSDSSGVVQAQQDMNGIGSDVKADSIYIGIDVNLDDFKVNDSQRNINILEREHRSNSLILPHLELEKLTVGANIGLKNLDNAFNEVPDKNELGWTAMAEANLEGMIS